jgi:hypothetical protein
MSAISLTTDVIVNAAAVSDLVVFAPVAIIDYIWLGGESIQKTYLNSCPLQKCPETMQKRSLSQFPPPSTCPPPTVSLSPKEDSCDLDIKSDEDRDSEIDRRAGVNAEGGQREVTESVPRSAPSDKPSQRKCGIINAGPSTIVEDDGVPWTDVWDAMKCSGWTWKGGSGLMTDYYHIKPKCRIQGDLSGRDYLCVSSGQSLQLARQYINADILRRIILKD